MESSSGELTALVLLIQGQNPQNPDRALSSWQLAGLLQVGLRGGCGHRTGGRHTWVFHWLLPQWKGSHLPPLAWELP